MASPPASGHCEDTALETGPEGEGREGIPDLAHTAGLTQGADGSHVALVPRAEFRGVVAGRGVQTVAGRHVACSLQVALAKREKKRREKLFCEHAHGRGRAERLIPVHAKRPLGSFQLDVCLLVDIPALGPHCGLSYKCKVVRSDRGCCLQSCFET